MLDELEPDTTEYTYATFKTVRVVNAHSIEMPGPRVLQLLISHRFGSINGGAYEFFGLDQANMRLGFEYGLNNRLSLGVGRSNLNKTYDGFAKLKLLRQRTGKKSFPFTLSALSSIQVNTLRWADPDRENYFSSRLSYYHQLLLARKFNSSLSLQLTPTVIHRNLVADSQDENDVFSIGFGGRIKITKSLTLNFEYFYLLPGQTADNFENVLSFGLDIETGGHVFQLIFSNSLAMTDNLFIPETRGSWTNGDIHFGFNLSRVFSTGKRAKW
jgi:hypothetical protein